jgi:hypothetical protein
VAAMGTQLQTERRAGRGLSRPRIHQTGLKGRDRFRHARDRPRLASSLVHWERARGEGIPPRRIISPRLGLCDPANGSHGSEILFSRPRQAGREHEGQTGAGGALRKEWGLGLWSIKANGTGP